MSKPRKFWSLTVTVITQTNRTLDGEEALGPQIRVHESDRGWES
jgi:hypothetical protein